MNRARKFQNPKAEIRDRNTKRPHLSPGESSGLFVVYGRRPVLELIRAGVAQQIEIVRTAHGRVIDEIVDLAASANIPLRRVEPHVQDEDGVEQGVRALAPAPELRGDLLSFAEQVDAGEQPLLLMLDGITDPHNFGALLRTAEGAGVAGVIIRERRQVPITPIVVKASAGAAYLLPIFEVNNLSRTLRELRRFGYWSVAACGDHDTRPYNAYDWKRSVVLVVGAEGAGVSELVRESADDLVHIPMFGRIDSLNVSVATGILLFAASDQRK